MKKKIFSFLIFLFLSSCGYEATYSKKNRINYNFSISELNFNGNKDINLKIKQRLNYYTLAKKNKDFQLKILSTLKKSIIAKDISGDATNFKIETAVTVEVIKNNKLENNFFILESFSYNDNSDKFKLKSYENEIKNNLTKTIVEKLIFKLSNIQ
jgi:outer membrane lipopolysaccharide assembly protein LptE/RlpB